ncbi:MAG: hypothetical protein QNJ84_04740 [Alphaproteobacteria bacterium]|nr:hypothetical protein [Alphaproteobacteria bacterium]
MAALNMTDHPDTARGDGAELPATTRAIGMYPSMRAAGRNWAIGAIHGDVEKLEALHDALAPLLRAGDTVVYLGNYLGYGTGAAEVVDELLRFRSWFLALKPFVHPADIVHLRGAQEEMFDRLLQIQFATDPKETLTWMLDRGLEATIVGYGSDVQSAFQAAGGGALAMTYWTSALRKAMQAKDGHAAFFSHLRRAAYLDNGAALFVSAGLDVDKPLRLQTDALWWASRSFEDIEEPYRGYARIVRGYDPEQRGFAETGCTISIDAGSGRGGDLLAVCLDQAGAVEQFLTA